MPLAIAMRKVGLFPWNGGCREGQIREERKERPENERVSAPVEYLRYSPRKPVGKPGSPVRKGGVVHRSLRNWPSRSRSF